MFQITEAAMDFAWTVNFVATLAFVVTLLVMYIAYRCK